MRLKKKQKEQLIAWVAEGLESGEINSLAADFDPPFNVKRNHIAYYRQTRRDAIREKIVNGENGALNSGLALRSVRVAKLKQLAEMLEQDLFGDDLLWTEQVKGVGAGAAATVVDYEEFNRPEVDAYRGLLDDIAKETGGRVQRQDITTDGKPILITTITHAKPAGNE